MQDAKEIGNYMGRSFSDEAWANEVQRAWSLIASDKYFNCSSREWVLVLLIETLYARADFEETKRNHKNIAAGFRRAANMLWKNNSNYDDVNKAWRVFTKTCNLEANEQ